MKRGHRSPRFLYARPPAGYTLGGTRGSKGTELEGAATPLGDALPLRDTEHLVECGQTVDHFQHAILTHSHHTCAM